MRCAMLVLAMLMGQAQAQTKKACAGEEPAYVALDSTLKACQAAAGGSTTPAYKACQTSYDAALKATGSDACKRCVAVNSAAQCYDMVKINAMIKGGKCTTIRSVEWESAYNRGKKEIIDYTLTCTACMPGGFKCVRNEYDLYGKNFGGGGVGQHTG